VQKKKPTSQIGEPKANKRAIALLNSRFAVPLHDSEATRQWHSVCKSSSTVVLTGKGNALVLERVARKGMCVAFYL
jgi:hypothetical protein